jgi:hypothetical protein
MNNDVNSKYETLAVRLKQSEEMLVKFATEKKENLQ